MSLYLALSISDEEEEEEEGTFSPAELAESLSSLKPHQVMVIGSVVLNEIVVGLAVSYLSVLMCGIGVLMAWRGFSPLRQLPTFHWVCVDAPHKTPRVLLSRLFYKHIHKQHHEWTAPISVTAIYCHPIEHTFSNLLPPFLGVSDRANPLFGAHLLHSWSVWRSSG
ncbi:fatty acid hydroxylase domain-containing protein 2-like isoform X2 [Nilaparvata lugens]|uniref:fatty acid hydroxylase domain-containing protein 2-like isoform X2 n=1 Tax=Nilaparvata lugens TaxID=108931 RepID=UPI00193E73A6|nr:fatty acid hydroxylase domain-containing protein 2-like isoform X2 [Nilaparvata lugens]